MSDIRGLSSACHGARLFDDRTAGAMMVSHVARSAGVSVHLPVLADSAGAQ